MGCMLGWPRFVWLRTLKNSDRNVTVLFSLMARSYLVGADGVVAHKHSYS